MTALSGYRGLPPADDAGHTYNNWLRAIVETKRARTRTPADIARTADQQALLAAAADSATSLASELRPKLGTSPATLLRFPLPTTRLTANELRHPNIVWETAMHLATTGAHQRNPATRADAAQTIFWVGSHVAWLEAGTLPDPPLDAFVHRTLNVDTLNADPQQLNAAERTHIDDAARELLRRLGGLAHVRGATVGAVQSDCPTMRAWWRVEASRQASEASQGDLAYEQCYETFANAGIWAAYVSAAMARTATLTAPRCAAALVAAARDHHNNTGHWPTRTQTVALLTNMARRAASIHPGLVHHRRLARLAAS